jgi:hypothetical protein
MGGQLRAPFDHADVDGQATFAAQVLLTGGHESAAMARTLMRGIDGEHSEVAAREAEFGVDAADELPGRIVCEQELPFEEVGREALKIGARTFEKRLDGEGGIDHGNEARDVGFGREADAKGRGGLGFGGHGLVHRNHL